MERLARSLIRHSHDEGGHRSQEPRFPDGELDRTVELGAVDDRSVRVWLRWPGAVRLRATLSVEQREPITGTIELSPDTDWTGGLDLALPQPAPDTPFTVSVADQELTGRFSPSPGSPSGLTFGFGSCHMPFDDEDGPIAVRDDAAIYPAMLDDLTAAGAARLLLLGDHIYADEIDGMSVEELADDGRPSAVTEFLHCYRRIYRGFFNEPGFRALRTQFPTVMMWDDHEIIDNWGSQRRAEPEYDRLFDAASRAFCEYQHLRNPGGRIADPPYPFAFSHGDIGFITLDLRGVRDYHDGRILGRRQAEWLRGQIENDIGQQSHTLFVGMTVPVAHVARWFTRLFELPVMPHSGSMRDRWNSTAFLESRNELLDLFFDWQNAAPHRQVFFLSGDVHAASGFSIRRKHGPGVIRQVTSSALTTPLILSQRVFNSVVVHGSNLFEPHYHFTRHFTAITHNFGLARVEPLATGGHRVEVAIRSWNPKRRRLETSGQLITVPGT